MWLCNVSTALTPTLPLHPPHPTPHTHPPLPIQSDSSVKQKQPKIKSKGKQGKFNNMPAYMKKMLPGELPSAKVALTAAPAADEASDGCGAP